LSCASETECDVCDEGFHNVNGVCELGEEPVPNSEESTNVGLIVGIVVPVAVVAALLPVAIYCIASKHGKGNPGENNEGQEIDMSFV